MNRLPTTDYTADFLRGWPNEGALESSIYPIADGQELEAGDLVILSNGELVAAPDANPINNAGIVVRGNKDDNSAVASGKAIVLWGGYIVRTTKIAGTLEEMDPVWADNGVFVTLDGTLGNEYPAVPNSSPMGTVLEFQAAAGGNPATAVIAVR